MILFHKKIYKNSLLIKWILSCLLILIIPMISLFTNYFFSQSMIVRKITDSNKTVLVNMKNTVDAKLKSILNLNHLLLIDSDFSNLFSPLNESAFYETIQKNYTKLNNYKYVYSDLDILVYLPYNDYIITSGVAAYAETIFNTLTYNKKETISFDQWQSLLNADYSKEVFFLSPYASYRNFGNDSFVYACTTPFVYNEEYKYTIMVSINNNFMKSHLDKTKDTTFLILGEGGNILRQYGPSIDLPPELLPPVSEENEKEVTINNEDYILTYIKSDINNWVYAICTPLFMLLKDFFFLRTVTLASIFASIILGTAFIIFSQNKNYKPVKKIMNYIPHELKSTRHNEFELIEQYYLALNNENNNMKKKIGSFADSAKEIYFLSKLKGRYFHLSESDVVESLSLEYDNKKYAIVSIYMDNNQSFAPREDLMHFDLLTFAIYNIADELLDHAYPYQKVVDGLFNVFIFFIEEDGEAKWKLTAKEIFEKLYDFFKEEFHITLSITIGNVFEDINQISDSYVDILDTFEYRHILKQSGIILVSDLKEIAIDSNEQLGQLLQQVIVAVAQKNLKRALELTNQFFEEQTRLDLSFVKCQYHIFSLISSLLLSYNFHVDNANSMDKNEVDNYLKEILSCKDKIALQAELVTFLNRIGGASVIETRPVDSSFITKIKTYVANHYSDYNMNIASIAFDMELTPKYMSKLFKEKTGYGLLNYINIVRINYAKELLTDSNVNVDEIASLVGFSNSRSFRRNFHKVTGITPSEYRK